MLKLATSISKKIGQPDFGSRGASVGLEVELDARLIEDPVALAEHIHRAFNIARDSVDQELNADTHPTNGRTNDRFGESKSGNGSSPGPLVLSALRLTDRTVR